MENLEKRPMNMVLPETLIGGVGEFGQQSSDGIGDFIHHNKWNQGTSCHLTGAVDRGVTTSHNEGNERCHAESGIGAVHRGRVESPQHQQ